MSQIFHYRFFNLLFAGLILSLPAIASSADSEKSGKDDPAEQATQMTTRPGQAVTAIVDAETGKFRPPTAEELEARNQRIQKSRRSKVDDYEIKTYADGTVVLIPRRAILHALVAEVDHDGKVTLRHGPSARDGKPEDGREDGKHEHR